MASLNHAERKSFNSKLEKLNHLSTNVRSIRAVNGLVNAGGFMTANTDRLFGLSTDDVIAFKLAAKGRDCLADAHAVTASAAAVSLDNVGALTAKIQALCQCLSEVRDSSIAIETVYAKFQHFRIFSKSMESARIVVEGMHAGSTRRGFEKLIADAERDFWHAVDPHQVLEAVDSIKSEVFNNWQELHAIAVLAEEEAERKLVEEFAKLKLAKSESDRQREKKPDRVKVTKLVKLPKVKKPVSKPSITLQNVAEHLATLGDDKAKLTMSGQKKFANIRFELALSLAERAAETRQREASREEEIAKIRENHQRELDKINADFEKQMAALQEKEYLTTEEMEQLEKTMQEMAAARDANYRLMKRQFAFGLCVILTYYSVTELSISDLQLVLTGTQSVSFTLLAMSRIFKVAVFALCTCHIVAEEGLVGFVKRLVRGD